MFSFIKNIYEFVYDSLLPANFQESARWIKLPQSLIGKKPIEITCCRIIEISLKPNHLKPQRGEVSSLNPTELPASTVPLLLRGRSDGSVEIFKLRHKEPLEKQAQHFLKYPPLDNSRSALDEYLVAHLSNKEISEEIHKVLDIRYITLRQDVDIPRSFSRTNSKDSNEVLTIKSERNAFEENNVLGHLIIIKSDYIFTAKSNGSKGTKQTYPYPSIPSSSKAPLRTLLQSTLIDRNKRSLSSDDATITDVVPIPVYFSVYEVASSYSLDFSAESLRFRPIGDEIPISTLITPPFYRHLNSNSTCTLCESNKNMPGICLDCFLKAFPSVDVSVLCPVLNTQKSFQGTSEASDDESDGEVDQISVLPKDKKDYSFPIVALSIVHREDVIHKGEGDKPKSILSIYKLTVSLFLDNRSHIPPEYEKEGYLQKGEWNHLLEKPLDTLPIISRPYPTKPYRPTNAEPRKSIEDQFDSTLNVEFDNYSKKLFIRYLYPLGTSEHGPNLINNEGPAMLIIEDLVHLFAQFSLFFDPYIFSTRRNSTVSQTSISTQIDRPWAEKYFRFVNDDQFDKRYAGWIDESRRKLGGSLVIDEILESSGVNSFNTVTPTNFPIAQHDDLIRLILLIQFDLPNLRSNSSDSPSSSSLSESLALLNLEQEFLVTYMLLSYGMDNLIPELLQEFVQEQKVEKRKIARSLDQSQILPIKGMHSNDFELFITCWCLDHQRLSDAHKHFLSWAKSEMPQSPLVPLNFSSSILFQGNFSHRINGGDNFRQKLVSIIIRGFNMVAQPHYALSSILIAPFVSSDILVSPFSFSSKDSLLRVVFHESDPFVEKAFLWGVTMIINYLLCNPTTIIPAVEFIKEIGHVYASLLFEMNGRFLTTEGRREFDLERQLFSLGGILRGLLWKWYLALFDIILLDENVGKYSLPIDKPNTIFNLAQNSEEAIYEGILLQMDSKQRDDWILQLLSVPFPNGTLSHSLSNSSAIPTNSMPQLSCPFIPFSFNQEKFGSCVYHESLLNSLISIQPSVRSLMIYLMGDRRHIKNTRSQLFLVRWMTKHNVISDQFFSFTPWLDATGVMNNDRDQETKSKKADIIERWLKDRDKLLSLGVVKRKDHRQRKAKRQNEAPLRNMGIDYTLQRFFETPTASGRETLSESSHGLVDNAISLLSPFKSPLKNPVWTLKSPSPIKVYPRSNGRPKSILISDKYLDLLGHQRERHEKNKSGKLLRKKFSKSARLRIEGKSSSSTDSISFNDESLFTANAILEAAVNEEANLSKFDTVAELNVSGEQMGGEISKDIEEDRTIQSMILVPDSIDSSEKTDNNVMSISDEFRAASQDRGLQDKLPKPITGETEHYGISEVLNTSQSPSLAPPSDVALISNILVSKPPASVTISRPKRRKHHDDQPEYVNGPESSSPAGISPIKKTRSSLGSARGEITQFQEIDTSPETALYDSAKTMQSSPSKKGHHYDLRRTKNPHEEFQEIITSQLEKQKDLSHSPKKFVTPSDVAKFVTSRSKSQLHKSERSVMEKISVQDKSPASPRTQKSKYRTPPRSGKSSPTLKKTSPSRHTAIATKSPSTSEESPHIQSPIVSHYNLRPHIHVSHPPPSTPRGHQKHQMVGHDSVGKKYQRVLQELVNNTSTPHDLTDINANFVTPTVQKGLSRKSYSKNKLSSATGVKKRKEDLTTLSSSGKSPKSKSSLKPTRSQVSISPHDKIAVRTPPTKSKYSLRQPHSSPSEGSITLKPSSSEGLLFSDEHWDEIKEQRLNAKEKNDAAASLAPLDGKSIMHKKTLITNINYAGYKTRKIESTSKAVKPNTAKSGNDNYDEVLALERKRDVSTSIKSKPKIPHAKSKDSGTEKASPVLRHSDVQATKPSTSSSTRMAEKSHNIASLKSGRFSQPSFAPRRRTRYTKVKNLKSKT